MFSFTFLMTLLITLPTTTGQSEVSCEINCPFFKFADPDTSNLFSFVQDSVQAGADGWLIATLSYGAALLQQGIFGTVPDLCRLDQIPLVSHTDLFNNYPQQVESMFRAASDTDGMITFDDMVNVKLWVADQEEVRPNIFSRGEVALLFIRSGGNVDTLQVSAEAVLAGLRAEFPSSGFEVVNFVNLVRLLSTGDF